MQNSLMITPRFWFNQHVFRFDTHCDDCPGACPDSMFSNMSSIPIKRFEREFNNKANQDIWLNRDTFLKNFGGHTVALNSKGQGIMVLDAEASRSLLYLSSPCTLKDLRTSLPEWSDHIFGGAISLLLVMNILASSQSQNTDVSQSESETLAAWLHLTNQCNLLCKYCYVSRNDQWMNASIAQHSVDAIFRSALVHGYKQVRLKYSGGEPTLNFDVLQIAQQRAEELRVRTGIELESVLLTNGIHITDTQIDSLLAHNIRVMVSLDGIGRHQDIQRPLADQNGSSFELVSHTLDQLLDRGISPHISITITRQSLNGLPDLVEYLLDRQLRFSFNFYRGLDSPLKQDPFAFTSDVVIGGLQAAFQVIERRLPRYSLLSNLADRADLRVPHVRTCGVGQNYLVIDCKGNISKCQMDMKHPITTINTEDPLETVRTDTSGIQNLTVDQKECRECLWRYRCTGSCPRLTFQHIGRYDAKSPFCEVYQTILPEVVRLEALRLLKYEEPWDFSSVPN